MRTILETWACIAISVGYRLSSFFRQQKGIKMMTRGVIERDNEGMDNVYADLDINFPDELYVGDGLAYFCSGWVFNPRFEVEKIEVKIGNYCFPIEDINQPRNDVFNYLLEEDLVNDGMKYAICSGFFGPLDLPPDLERNREKVTFVATFKNGEEYLICEKEVCFLKREEYFSPVNIQIKPEPNEPLVAICMGIYSPQKEPFQRQIDSIKSQSYKNWICIISDDGSNEATVKQVKEAISNDRRFYFFKNNKNMGFYNNFECALRYVPEGAELVALSDQDDYWYPYKLEKLVKEIEKEKRLNLVYSDMKIVKENGEPISDTYWKNRKNYYEDLAMVLVANTVTGAASIFRRELLQKALPFPQNLGRPFHDHVLACSALATGEIGYIDEPLYDYIQYDSNVIGHHEFGIAKKGFLRLLFDVRSLWPHFYHLIEMYDADYVRIRLLSRTLELRCDRDVRKLRIFNNKISSVIKLLLLHLKVKRLRQTTGNAELKLAFSYLARRYYKMAYARYRRIR